MRVTTNSILRGYTRNLGTSMNNLNSAREKVMTKRNFNKIAEDPAAAAKAFRYRQQYAANEDYLDNVENTISQFDAVDSSAQEIVKALKDINADILKGINGATGEEQRKTLATSLKEAAKSIVLSANAKFGDTFIFGGNNTKDVPFVYDEATGELTYRGIDVNSTNPNDITKLSNLADEKLFTDLGFGLQETAGVLEENSAFNTSIPGINLLGYGTNADGTSKNIVTLLHDVATELEQPTLDEDKFKLLTDQFTESRNSVIDFESQLGTKSKFLNTTKERLENYSDTLNEKIVGIENIDLAEAISSYSWAQYAYNAALQVGNSILSPSFIDFMK